MFQYKFINGILAFLLFKAYAVAAPSGMSNDNYFQSKNDIPQWNYSTPLDKMTGKSYKNITLYSQNSLNLGFPYSGTNLGGIEVRRHPSFGVDVLVSIQKGQILCSAYTKCSVKFKFGNESPITVTATAPDDHSTELIFIQNPKRVIELLKKHKEFFIEIPIYRAGHQILEFKVLSPIDF